jgi:hypothetical protein
VALRIPGEGSPKTSDSEPRDCRDSQPIIRDRSMSAADRFDLAGLAVIAYLRQRFGGARRVFG